MKWIRSSAKKCTRRRGQRNANQTRSDFFWSIREYMKAQSPATMVCLEYRRSARTTVSI